MKRGFGARAPSRPSPQGAWNILADAGFRCFFLLGALYAVILPLTIFCSLPVPFPLWHRHEMLIGVFGAALIGFLTTAAPQWTNSEPPRGGTLRLLAAAWGIGRVSGYFGREAFATVGAIADAAWIVALLFYLLRLSRRQRSEHLFGFSFWIAILLGCVLATDIGFVTATLEHARRALELIGLSCLGLSALVLARIAVPLTNLVLDPSGATSPFRPHPGRLPLAPCLVLVAISGELAGLSSAVSGFLLMAAGAAFIDRVGEAFIGRAALQAEILMLAAAPAFAGIGLILAGCARLGAPWSENSGLDVAFIGGIGGSVYAVFSIVARFRTGGALGQTRLIRFGAIALYGSAILRILADFAVTAPRPSRAMAAFLWAGAFLVWFFEFWPDLSRVERKGEK